MDNTENRLPEEKAVSKKEARKAKKEAKKQAKAEKKANKKKLSSEDKKGVLLIVVLVIVAVVLLKVCINAGDKADVSAESTTVTTTAAITQTAPVVDIITTTQPVTQAPTTEALSATAPTQGTTAPVVTEKQETTDATVTTVAPAPTEPAALTDAEILEIVTKGVNSLKSDTANFRGHKKRVIDIQLVECSLPAVTGIVNKVIEVFIGEKEFDYDFTNGVSVNPDDGSEITSRYIFPPQDRDFALVIEGVAKTSVTETAEGTVYEVTVVPESTTLEDPRPPHQDSAGDVLYLSNVELPVGEVTKADFEYPGATYKVTLDKDGKVVGYEQWLYINGTGEAAGLGLSASGVMEGCMSEVWTIEWK